MIWGSVTIDDKKSLHIEFGTLDLWINNSEFEGEWIIGADYSAKKQKDRIKIVSEQHAPADLDWHRWISGNDEPLINLDPVMPNRPIIIRPKIPVTILPGQLCTLFMEIPVFIKLSAGKEKLHLCEIPSTILSNSWFGSPNGDGFQCYSTRTPARKTLTSIKPFPYQVVCPIEVKNKSAENLNCKHFCVQVEFLDIYKGDKYMWSNLGRISYRGEEKWSSLVFSDKAPAYDNAKTLIGKARNPARGNLIFKSFGHFNHFS